MACGCEQDEGPPPRWSRRVFLTGLLPVGLLPPLAQGTGGGLALRLCAQRHMDAVFAEPADFSMCQVLVKYPVESLGLFPQQLFNGAAGIGGCVAGRGVVVVLVHARIIGL
jgi:hypothetical protein